jgi:hypothetical protein
MDALSSKWEQQEQEKTMMTYHDEKRTKDRIITIKMQSCVTISTAMDCSMNVCSLSFIRLSYEPCENGNDGVAGGMKENELASAAGRWILSKYVAYQRCSLWAWMLDHKVA